MDMGAAFFVLHPYTTEDFIGEQMEKKIKIKTNLTAGIIFVMMALGVAVLIPSQIKMTSIVKEAVDSRFIPQILCWVMGVLGCWLIIKSLMLKKRIIWKFPLIRKRGEHVLWPCLLSTYF